MKILYAIQGTGNGHMARAMDLIPEFKKYGKVDILLSGYHYELNFPFDIKYHFQGFGYFFGNNGGINIRKTYQKNSIIRFVKEITELPVEKYDLVISDFEPVSAWACRLKGRECISMSHQAAVMDAPYQPASAEKWMGKNILKYYAPGHHKIGFHFRAFKDFIFTPIIRKKVREITPDNLMHYTVYLPSYSDLHIINILSKIDGIEWKVFSKNASVPYSYFNVSISPINNDKFIESLASSTGVLCNAGFETPAEALFLQKKLCVVPMKHQYEQAANAEMLKSFKGVCVLPKFSENEVSSIKNWILSEDKPSVHYPDNVSEVVLYALSLADTIRKDIPYPTVQPLINY